MLGRDEALLIANLKIANTLGSKIHNIQLFSHNTSGKLIGKQDVADFYEFALKQVECRPLFRSTCQYVVGGFLASFGSWTNSRIHGITFSDNARP